MYVAVINNNYDYSNNNDSVIIIVVTNKSLLLCGKFIINTTPRKKICGVIYRNIPLAIYGGSFSFIGIQHTSTASDRTVDLYEQTTKLYSSILNLSIISMTVACL